MATEPNTTNNTSDNAVKIRKCKTNNLSIDTIKNIIYKHHYGTKLKELCSEYCLSTTSIYNVLKTTRIPQNEIDTISSKAKIQKLIDDNNRLIEINKELIKQLEAL